MNKILVTGGAGFVGSSLIPKLLEEGYKVEILDSMIHENSHAGLSSYVQGGTLISHPNFYGLTKGDVRDKNLVEVVEINEHPWFIGCQFHPEFTSNPIDGHPLFKGFIDAANNQKQSRLGG